MRVAELLTETTSQDEDLVIIAQRLTKLMNAYKKSDHVSSILKDFIIRSDSEITRYAAMNYGVPLSKLKLPKFKDPAINKLIGTISIGFAVMEPNLSGVYYPSSKSIDLNIEAEMTDYSGVMLIAHELRHALDDVIGKIDMSKIYKAGTKEYYDSQHEINARVIELLADCYLNFQELSAEGVLPKNINHVIDKISMNELLAHFKLADVSLRQRKRILTRLYLFATKIAASPKRITKPTLIQKLKAIFTGAEAAETVED